MTDMVFASLFLLLLPVISTSEHVDCSLLLSCSQCIATPSCAWCSTPGSAVCLSVDSTDQCNSSHIVNPKSNLTMNTLPLDGSNRVSLSSVKLKMRVGESLTFNFSARAPENAPLDLYILMDLSFSFQNELSIFKNTAPQLFSTLQNIAADTQIGFGAFVDKPIAPFNAPVAIDLSFTVGGQPSACSFTLCSRPFSYQHVVNITNSTDIFSASLQNLVISTSSDNPEGTLDAMMQAVVCTNVVGWRKESHKILLVITDDSMHTAGDGRLAGIYKPNDAQCHTQFDLSENKILNLASLEYDYPSIEQMKVVLQQYRVLPVFVLTRNGSSIENVSQLLGGFHAISSSELENLNSIVEQAYYRLLNMSQVQLNIPNHDYLQVATTTSCPPGSTPLSNGYGCDGSINTANFSVSVTLTKCTEILQNFGREVITAELNPGFGTFVLEIEGHCSCDCEIVEVASEACSGNGNRTCSECVCFDGWTGNDCSCSNCPKGPNGLICSGRGTCNCAKCVCYDSFYGGSSCEMDQFQCHRGQGGLLCSGQGLCTYSNGEYSCSCNVSTMTGHKNEGSVCQCSYSICVDPMDPCRNSQDITCSLCSKHGSCDPCHLGCKCDEGFYGKYCQHLSKPQCSGNIDCILCYGRAARHGDNPAIACQSLKCAGYSVMDRQQQVGNEMHAEGITNSTIISCSLEQDECSTSYNVLQTSTNEMILYEVISEECLSNFTTEQPLPAVQLPSWGISLIASVGFAIIWLLIVAILSLVLLSCIKPKKKMLPTTLELKSPHANEQEE